EPQERRGGQHHRLRQVLRRQAGRPPGRQPPHRRARENQSLQGAQVHGRRRPQAGDQPQEEVGTTVTLVSELDLPSFDYTDPTLRGDAFHAAMAEVREASWLAQAPFGYMVLDREAGEHFLRTRSAIFPGMKIAEIFGVTEGPLHEQMVRNILHVNGPDHSRLRSLVNPALSPRAVERYRPRMRGFLEGLFAAAVEGAGEGDEVRCDFVEAFAKPYPSQVIASVMGAPLEDAPRLHHWSNWIQKQFDAGSMASEKDKIEEAVEEFYEYAEGLLRARRADPGDDLMSRFIEAEEEGDRLSDVECINLVFNIL